VYDGFSAEAKINISDDILINMSKELDTAVILIIIAGWLLLVNSLNFSQSYKILLYFFTFVFIGSWLIFIIKS
jgi:hypothetical protein